MIHTNRIILLLFAGLCIGWSANVSAQYRDIHTGSGANQLHFAEVRYSFSANMKDRIYHSFINTVETRSSFSDHSEIGFVFHQNRLFGKPVHVFEHLFLMSQIGIGIETGISFSIHTNRFFRLLPNVRYMVSSVSSGLKDYTMLRYSAGIGLDLTFMPGQNVTFSGVYYPAYDIRYGSHDKQLMTFDGSGWEYGFRLFLPRSMVHPFRFLFFDVDLSRMPITFTLSTIRDSYTEKELKIKKLTIGILFN
ncbi:hypothetical protein JXO52_14105 [bacterium]|nr:hypothetical protein [bacterium]